MMRKQHPLTHQALSLDQYCEANHLLVSFSGRARGLVDDALASVGRERRILLTVNQFFTAGQAVAGSDLVMDIPKHLINATGMSEELVYKRLPFDLPEVHIDMLWHERDGRNPGHQWLRDQVRKSSQETMANSI